MTVQSVFRIALDTAHIRLKIANAATLVNLKRFSDEFYAGTDILLRTLFFSENVCNMALFKVLVHPCMSHQMFGDKILIYDLKI